MYWVLGWCIRMVLAKDINQYYIDGLVQERLNSNALAMELRLSCTNPSICIWDFVQLCHENFYKWYSNILWSHQLWHTSGIMISHLDVVWVICVQLWDWAQNISLKSTNVKTVHSKNKTGTGIEWNTSMANALHWTNVENIHWNANPFFLLTNQYFLQLDQCCIVQ